MKTFIKIIVIAILAAIGLFCIVNKSNAQSFEQQGNTFICKKKAIVKSEPEKTEFKWQDSKGNTYPVYISSTGSCFVIKTSAKTGKEYRNYLGPELSKIVCDKLGRTYKSKKNDINRGTT